MNASEGLRTAVMISGSGTNLQAIIDATSEGTLAIDLCGVICDRPDAGGLNRAERAGIPTQVVDYRDHKTRARAEIALAEAIDAVEPDLVVLAGFMRILPDELVARWEGRMLNIHPSLLPKYRGLNTYRRALAAGERWHGSTVHYVIPALDAGPAIVQYRVAIRPDDTEKSLAGRVQQGEYRIYPMAIGWIATGRLRLVNGEVIRDGVVLAEPIVVKEPEEV